MDKKCIGKAFLINNVADSFPQTRVDFETLCKSYRTLGFDVSEYENCDEKVNISFKFPNFPFLSHINRNLYHINKFQVT